MLKCVRALLHSPSAGELNHRWRCRYIVLWLGTGCEVFHALWALFIFSYAAVRRKARERSLAGVGALFLTPCLCNGNVQDVVSVYAHDVYADTFAVVRRHPRRGEKISGLAIV